MMLGFLGQAVKVNSTIVDLTMYWLSYWHSCAEYFAHNYHMHTSPEWDSNLGPKACPYLNFRN